MNVETSCPSNIAISGVGLLTPLGHTASDNMTALTEGKSALQSDPLSAVGAQYASIKSQPLQSDVPDSLETQIRFLNRAGLCGVEVAREAMLHAGLRDASTLDTTETPHARRGLYLAQVDCTQWGNSGFWQCVSRAPKYAKDNSEQGSFNRAGARHVRPYLILEDLKNNAFSFIATWFGLGGTNSSATSYAGAGAQMISAAARSIRNGQLDMALIVSAAATGSGYARVESRKTMENPTWAHGEGAAAIVLESTASLASRKGKALAYLGAYATRRKAGWRDVIGQLGTSAYSPQVVSARIPDAVELTHSWDGAWGDMAQAHDVASIAISALCLASEDAKSTPLPATAAVDVVSKGLRDDVHAQRLHRA